MSYPTLRHRGCCGSEMSPKMRSIHVGPSSSMKKVMKTIVSVATTAVITPFVTESAAPAPTAKRPTPPLRTAAFTFSTMW